METEELYIQQIITVIDTGNYKSSYSEETPFSARIEHLTNYPTVEVQSLVTGKKYELYPNQVRVDLPYKDLNV